MLVLAAAVALRLRGLRSFGLWQDELISWEMTSNGLHHYLTSSAMSMPTNRYT